MKLKTKLLSIITIIFCSFFLNISGALAAEETKMFYPGEELEYDVSFLGVKLGKIKLNAEIKTTHNGKPVYKAKAYMDSYSGIPFVDLHAIFDSWFDQSASYSYKFEGKVKGDYDAWDFQGIYFDYQNKWISNEKWINKQLDKKTVIKTDKKISDGLSLLYLARQFVEIKKTVTIPTFIDEQIGYTYINFNGNRENVKIAAVNYPVKTIAMDGRADWEGIYGIKGKFEGWFSDDEAHIPIKAKMTVYVGSVTIELVKWKRGDWAPPKAN